MNVLSKNDFIDNLDSYSVLVSNWFFTLVFNLVKKNTEVNSMSLELNQIKKIDIFKSICIVYNPYQ